VASPGNCPPSPTVQTAPHRPRRPGATTHSVVTNLGAQALIAYHQVRQPGARSQLAAADLTAESFAQARARLAQVEVPATRRRSLGRSLRQRLRVLRDSWLGHRTPDG